MAHIVTLRGVRPRIGKNCFLAPTAVIIGDVEIGDNCSIWYGCVLRGDVNAIRIGNGVNIQDNATIHTLYQQSQSILGDNVSVGHNAVVHGAIVESGALVGMGATLLDNCRIGAGAIVAAGALVSANKVVDPATLWAGVPAKFIKALTPEQSRNIAERTSRDYQMYASWFLQPDTTTEQIDRT